MYLDTSHQNDIEHDIRPGFANVVTIPLGEEYEGICLYIGSSGFRPVEDEALQIAVNEIVKKLKRKS